MLSRICSNEFLSGDRARGSRQSLRNRIDITEIGSLGALAVTEGSAGEEYILGVDFQKIDDGQLGVSCDCLRFQGGNPCKHLYALLSKLDHLYDAVPSGTSRLRFFDIDSTILDVGSKLDRRRPKKGLAKNPSKTTPAGRSQASDREAFRSRVMESILESMKKDGHVASRASAIADIPNTVTASTATQSSSGKSNAKSWKETLQRIGASIDDPLESTNWGIPSKVFEQDLVPKQHWFVWSLSERQSESSMIVQVMHSVRKKNGQWATPVSVSNSPPLVDPTIGKLDRAVLAALSPSENPSQSYGYRSYQARSHDRLKVDPASLEVSLRALAATGRFAWKLGHSKRFEDAQAILSVDTGPRWKLALVIRPNPAKANGLVVEPELVRGNDVLPISSVMLACDVGCGVIQLPGPVPATGQVSAGVVCLDPQETAAIRAWQSVGKVAVPGRSINTMLTELSATQGHLPLTIDPSIAVTETTGTPMPQCHLSQVEPGVARFYAELMVRYDDHSHSYDAPRRWWFDRKTKTLVHRNVQAESEQLAKVDAADFDVNLNDYESKLIVGRDRFLTVVERLRSDGWEVLADGVAIRLATDFNVSVNSGVDWFDLHADADFGGVSAALPELLAALRSGDRTILLDDGTLGMLPEAWLKRFASLVDSGNTVDGAVRFGRSQAMLLDAMLETQGDVSADRSFTDFVGKLKSFDGVKSALPPKSFTGTLRHYQEVGLGWFQFLEEFGFGGCLADDMGLGKTIQVLALFEHRRLRNLPKKIARKPSIVVVPKSLVFNWIQEAKQFTPGLRVINHTGVDRQQEPQSLLESDLIVTTYGTLRNDAPWLNEVEFDYAVLDEAQAIKNPSSLSAKAARLLKADHRLAMTGTPVENHLGDLWSLFDFLNPGMLGKAPKTVQLDDEQDRLRIEQVSRSLRPFILRRTKKQVLTELPEKSEQTLACEMSKPQAKLYDEIREHYRLHLSKKVAELGIKRSKIHVLEALLRLRQVACDPRLVDPTSKVSGAKIDSLFQQLEEITSEGHKVLVFSQFTKLLGLIRNEVQQRGWDHEYLDGKTRRRDKCVQRFQDDDDCKLFLISLKAGGNGLNLTAADYVFILDPWWNPAVEAQAIDRAHRMGQTKPVMAYRMICTGTVEDKIMELQKSKRDLADAIISQDKSLISGLTADDLQALLA
ncbi:ATP-dependent helicase HepA [Rubripirellula lacrimiformis]|uniref:ATP-dependent helicase HepA n=1 Tax=Rubripirellula lacrimiformis TaxID=1930273 RepID=A0A517N9B4_9BACT|nr:SNF2-related protein [Rubripirellula lacrimiformis]QDT03727.1 ATP-dependent helicase HepA [Rubripirellula lacrimiformis]